MRPPQLARLAWLAVASALAPSSAAVGQTTPPHIAQERAKGPRIGVFLWHDSPNDAATLAGIRAGFATARVSVEFVERHADSDPARAAKQLRELDGQCRLVIALGTKATLLAREHVRQRPIVFAAVTNPVTAGIVDDWQHSGDNLCGASNWIDPQNVLEVFRLAVPDLRRLGIVRSRQSGIVSAAELAGMRQFLRSEHAPAIAVHEIVVDDHTGLAAAAQALQEQGVDAIWVPIDLEVYSHIEALLAGLGENRLPLLTTAAAGVKAGALVGAAVDYHLHGRRAAALVQRILRTGSVPPDLAVDRMRSSLVVVNLKAARAIGIELPLSLLALADELIAPPPTDDGGERR